LADSTEPPHGASLPVRLAAMVYDGLLLFAVLFVATAALTPVTGGGPVSAGLQPLYRLYLLAVGFGFFGWFWTHGGQTLGMRAWRLRVVGADGRPPGWGTALLRFFGAGASAAALGLGYLWALVDRRNRCWHDMLSRTVVVRLPKES
jgi:uncharacterized RDD family membrane protein YckC